MSSDPWWISILRGERSVTMYGPEQRANLPTSPGEHVMGPFDTFGEALEFGIDEMYARIARRKADKT